MQSIIWQNLDATAQATLLQRPMCTTAEAVRTQSTNIIAEVRQHGDTAIRNYTEKFDRVRLASSAVTTEEMKHAATLIPEKHRQAIQLAIKQLNNFHQPQLPNTLEVDTCPGVSCQRVAKPIRRVGLYVPGGSAPLVSTVLMLAVPAQIAQCALRVLVTPPNADGHIDPHILYAADLCNIRHIFKMGGAQAIAALAYGTESVPKVDKIFGPGNAWVTQAKILVSQDPAGASCDLPAGPSELMIIADHTANAELVAADLLSQAEHGADSQVILITTSAELATQVESAVTIQLNSLPRRAIAQAALRHSYIILVDNLAEAFTISNTYAPEHLTLNIAQAEHWAGLVECAGAVFLGPWTAESFGDYVTGANHVLPTYGYAHSISGLGVIDFMTFINFQTVSEQGVKAIGESAEILATIEGLHAHQRAVSLRIAALNTIMENTNG